MSSPPHPHTPPPALNTSCLVEFSDWQQGDQAYIHECSRTLVPCHLWVTAGNQKALVTPPLQAFVIAGIPKSRLSAGEVSQGYTLLSGAHKAQVLNTMLVFSNCCDHRTLLWCDFKAQECVPSWVTWVHGSRSIRPRELAGPCSL